jgi:DegV family protein with EDD domain
LAIRTALVTDSTSNLPLDWAAEAHVYVAPLYIIWGEDAFKDAVEITPDEFYRRLTTVQETPTSSQVSPQDFVEIFQHAREAEQADVVVCAVLSSDLSGTYASASQAKEMVDFPVHVVDTRQVSWALGFPVMCAVEARDKGAPPDEIRWVIELAARRQHLLFTIESLDYLHRGGRIGNARLLLGSALNIKPLLELKDGVVSSVDNVRTRKRAIEHMITTALDHACGHPIARLAIIHGDAEEEARDLLEKAVEKLRPRQTFFSHVTAVLGVHTGPGALGVIVEWDIAER